MKDTLILNASTFRGSALFGAGIAQGMSALGSQFAETSKTFGKSFLLNKLLNTFA